MDIQGIVPLDEESLLRSAMRRTGLSDFGGEEWREPLRVMLDAIEREADLNLMGRLMARSDILILLENRLRLADLRRRHPEITDERIEKPLFITGLARSGTSILFEILAQDPACRVPRSWEALFPFPPPETATYDSDPRIARADALLKQWARVAPEYAAMHEMGGDIPCECGMIFNPAFLSDHLAAIHQVPSYLAWLARADLRPAYRFHREMLRVLQWRHRGRYWLLKAPWHLGHLQLLFEVYPDARVVQTHRDPIVVMSSVTSLLGTILWMRSDRPFDSDSWDELTAAEDAAARLEAVMRERDDGLVPQAQICDVLYRDIVSSPLDVVRRIYAHFGMRLTDEAVERMERYAASKPQGKLGAHRYDLGSADEVARERKLFRRYQERYGVPSEV